MEHAPLLAGWESVYVIIGSSAGALTGLQFVVRALIAESPSRQSAETLSAIAGAAMLLVFIGIHNAWDTIQYLALQSEPGGADGA